MYLYIHMYIYVYRYMYIFSSAGTALMVLGIYPVFGYLDPCMGLNSGSEDTDRYWQVTVDRFARAAAPERRFTGGISNGYNQCACSMFTDTVCRSISVRLSVSEATLTRETSVRSLVSQATSTRASRLRGSSTSCLRKAQTSCSTKGPRRQLVLVNSSLSRQDTSSSQVKQASPLHDRPSPPQACQSTHCSQPQFPVSRQQERERHPTLALNHSTTNLLRSYRHALRP